MVRQLIHTLFIAIGLLCISSHSLAAELKSSVDRTQLSEEEHVRLTIELSNSDTRLRAQGVKPNIDLTLLTDNFTLSTPIDDHRYNIFQGRGRSSSSITVDLFPRHSGTHTIPSFSVDGLNTQPITIKVAPRSADIPAELFVRSGTNKEIFWVNEQVIAYIDLYHRVAIDEASFGDNLETEPTRIEILPHWKLDQSSRKESVQNFEYDVQRIAWSVFPQQAGEFTVQLPDVWITTKTGRKQRLSHQRLRLNIKALPEGVPENIIMGKPEVHQTNLPAHTNQYELTHWSISIHAPVAVTSLPDYLPGVTLPEGLKLYADTARRNTLMNSSGIIDQADYIISAMPLEAGEYTIKPIHIPYFDIEKGEADYIALPAQALSVASATPPKPVADIPSRDIEIKAVNAPRASPHWIWPSATALFASLWLATLIAWWIKQRNSQEKSTTPTQAPALPKDTRPPLQLQLLNAMQSKTLEEGLANWQQHHPQDTTVAEAVRAVQKLCYGKSDDKPLDIEEKVKLAINTLRECASRPQNPANDIWDPKAFSR